MSIRFTTELRFMKMPISKSHSSVLYFIMTDRRVRRVRDVVLFTACLPVYYTAFSISRGRFSLNKIFLLVFGLLCVMGLFGEMESLRIFAAVGVVLCLVEIGYVKMKERENLKFI